MDAVIQAISDFGNWLLGIAEMLGSAVASFFEALWIFATDWAVFGTEVAFGLAAARLSGIEVDLPTPAELVAALPAQMQMIVYRVGLPEAFGYWATAVTIRFGIWGLRLSSYLRSW